MKKSKLALLVASAFVATTSYANWNQHVALCLDVKGNTSPYVFSSSFVSSDFFDRDNSVKVKNGQKCAGHTYNHGPKNIKLDVQVAESAAVNDVKLIPDSTCDMLYSTASGWYKSDYIRSDKHSEGWYINLNQTTPQNGYKYVFNMTCSYQAS